MSKRPEWIDEYLTATRRVLPERISPERYSKMHDIVAAQTKPSGCATELVITYSYSGTTEIVASQGETCLVYDQFAGECFAGLNWLFSTRVSGTATQGFFDFVMGQKLLCARSTRPMLVYFAHAMLERQEFPWQSPLPPTSESNVWDRLAIQEAFAICHELAHDILWQQSAMRDAAINAARRRVQSAVEGKELQVETLYRDDDVVPWASTMFSIPVTDKQLSSLDANTIEKLRNLKQSMTPASVRSFYRRATANPNTLLEELAADDIAVFLTLMAVVGDEPPTGTQWKEILLSLFIGFRHITNLQLLNHHVSRLLTAAWGLKTSVTPDLAAATSLRTQVLHRVMCDLMFVLADDAYWPSVEAAILQAETHYWDIIGRHFMLDLPINTNTMIERMM